ncbi:MAG: HAD-IIIC family phosphatase [Spirochaetia bacterium]|nr:HAD-IIIC family phosphatase [Spirochaetia bacterium]
MKELSFKEIKRNLKKDFSDKKHLKVALLGDSATQLLNQAIRGIGYETGLDIEIWEADFDQIEHQTLTRGSELYEFAPDVVIVFFSTKKLLHIYDGKQDVERENMVKERLALCEGIYQSIKANSQAKVLFFNYPEWDDRVFGCLGNRLQQSFIYQIRLLNLGLMELSAKYADCFIVDLASIQNEIGAKTLFDHSIYVSTEMVIAVDALPLVANRIVDVIATIYGNVHKCLICDLDNTLWGGVIGDDGMENIQLGMLGIGKAFTELQHWVKKLSERGIIIAICSKNDEQVAKEPFEKHPDMVLRMQDISVFVANWDDKASNIRRIQKILNIGFDSIVFIDDNPFERNLVRKELPMVCVPELPQDPAEYMDYLCSQNLFETVSYSEADKQRTTQYQEEARRAEAQTHFTNEEEFLASLEMVSVVSPFNSYNTPRVAQLSQRSNQFNLRTIRWSEEDVAARSSDESYATFAFTLRDKFGDNGLICVVAMKRISDEEFFIENWYMSCRVLKRGMEDFTLNTLVEQAKRLGAKRIIGEYLPTPKNGMVKEHYSRLGFSASGDNRWVLDVPSFQFHKNHISKQEAN